MGITHHVHSGHTCKKSKDCGSAVAADWIPVSCHIQETDHEQSASPQKKDIQFHGRGQGGFSVTEAVKYRGTDQSQDAAGDAEISPIEDDVCHVCNKQSKYWHEYESMSGKWCGESVEDQTSGHEQQRHSR